MIHGFDDGGDGRIKDELPGVQEDDAECCLAFPLLDMIMIEEF